MSAYSPAAPVLAVWNRWLRPGNSLIVTSRIAGERRLDRRQVLARRDSAGPGCRPCAKHRHADPPEVRRRIVLQEDSCPQRLDDLPRQHRLVGTRAGRADIATSASGVSRGWGRVHRRSLRSGRAGYRVVHRHHDRLRSVEPKLRLALAAQLPAQSAAATASACPSARPGPASIIRKASPVIGRHGHRARSCRLPNGR